MKKSHQGGIITKIKGSRGAGFSSAGVHRLSQQWADPSESSPQKHTHTHIQIEKVQSWHTVASLNLEKPQRYKKRLNHCCISFPLSLHSKQHSPCTDQTMPSCFGYSASAPGQNTSWTAPGFPAPPECTSPVWGGIKHKQQAVLKGSSSNDNMTSE